MLCRVVLRGSIAGRQAGGAELPLRSGSERRGVVLLAVLVVLVLLSLAAYQYTDLMIAEMQASENYHRVARVKALAESGVHYAGAILANPMHWEDMLGNNPFDNREVFRSVPVLGEDGTPIGFFTLLAPVDPDDNDDGATYRCGVSDETGKINLNALMKKDETGQELHDMLKKLPNMTDDLAASIVDWLDANSDTFAAGLGAENDYYAGHGYRAKNGPIDSLEELLLVKGVSEELLFGTDRNRNGIQDPDERDQAFERGWSAYLTIHSREQAINNNAEPLIYINEDAIDLEALYDAISPRLDDDDLAKFVILYKQYGARSASTGRSQSLGSTILSLLGGGKSSSKGGSSKGGSSKGGKGGGKGGSSQPEPVQGNLADVELDFNKAGTKKLRSLFDLVEAEVEIRSSDPQTPSVYFVSPLKDKSARAQLLPRLFETLTTFEGTEIPARINVNTAPREVLEALPGLTPGNIEAILRERPRWSAGETPSNEFTTPAWLVTKANLSVRTAQGIEKLVTARSQVFKVQVLGYLEENKGPAARVEAVIDTNGGRPRILAWRDLSDLGRTIRPTD